MQAKKTIYIILSAFLFIIISYGLHAIIEMIILKTSDQVVWYSHFGGVCALHPIINYGLPILGIIFGILIGFKWWRIVYIEKRHWRLKK